jgi:hypothetical protein
MKKHSYILFAAFAVLSFLTGCEREFETKDISRITYFPVATLNGDMYLTIHQGDAWTDPGIGATINGETVTYSTVGTVDPQTPGVYEIVYTTVENVDGFSSSLRRFVGVIAPDAVSNNLSGIYARTSNGSVVTWTKIADGLYSLDNVGGSPGFEIAAFVFNPSGYVIDVPSQPSSVGELDCVNEEFIPGTPDTYKWVVINGNFGTATRTFEKQ